MIGIIAAMPEEITQIDKGGVSDTFVLTSAVVGEEAK